MLECIDVLTVVCHAVLYISVTQASRSLNSAVSLWFLVSEALNIIMNEISLITA
jgi:hypothetical protein